MGKVIISEIANGVKFILLTNSLYGRKVPLVSPTSLQAVMR